MSEDLTNSIPREVTEIGKTIEFRSVFPIRDPIMHEYYRDHGVLTSFEHPKFGTIETTSHSMESSFQYNVDKIANGINAVRETRGVSVGRKIEFEPIKQSRNDEKARTCSVATAANVARALIPGLTVTEQHLLDDIGEGEFLSNGRLPGNIALSVLEKNYPVDPVDFDKRDPLALIDILDEDGVVQAVWNGHARLISGYFIDDAGGVFVVVNDPLLDEPGEYAVDLEELFTIYLSYGRMSLAAYKRKDEHSGVNG